MIYFFSRDGDSLQCEIHPGSPRELTVVRASSQQADAHDSSEGFENRWRELTRHLQAGGMARTVRMKRS
jgi:hypothetical protein